jgi:hypothetical protein
MSKEHLDIIRRKVEQLEHALESDTPFATAAALTNCFDICKAALQALPDIIDVHPDFFKELEASRIKWAELPKTNAPLSSRAAPSE